MIDYGMVMWLDWCCDDVNVSVPGLVPDSWFNQIYAGLPVADGHRGYSWARAGSQLGGGNVLGNDPLASPGTGPWADHRSTVQFTGDTYPTWGTLQFETEYTAAETSIGLAYVSHDIGSFHADHLPDDLYARWVQFGAFQPALRLHSDHGDRLPWEYDAEAQASAETFLRLREAMLPYNYTLGWQAHTTGASMARPLWFAYPTVSNAYSQPGEYMWGDELLVAPVTVGGTPTTTQVWFPPGVWVAFADAGLAPQVYQGPGTYSVTTTLASMPVFAKAGSIVPMQSYTSNAAVAADTFEPRVVGGADGQYTLYEDEGEGFGYQSGQSATTLMTLKGSLFTISARKGTYPNASTSRAYQVLWSNIPSPTTVTVNGATIDANDGGAGDGWSYDPGTQTLTLNLSARSVSADVAVQLQ
jgi:alpha-glucosidase (family GH31 glycosyl hydrolase)